MAADLPVFTLPPSARAARLLRLGAFGACALAALLGALGLLGWAFDLAALKQPLPGQTPIKLNTSVCLLLCAGALASQLRGRRSLLAYGCIAGVAALALLTLLEYSAGWDLGIDQLLVADRVSQLFPGRMAIGTSSGLALLSLAMALHGRPRAFPIVCVAAGTTMAVAWVVLIGYIYGVASLYNVLPYERVAPQSALALFLLSLGVLLSWPGRGLAGLLAQGSAAGLMARRLLPAALLIPLGLGWLRWQGQLAGYYNTAFGLSLFVAMNTLVFAAVIWWNARALQLIDRDRHAMAEALLASQQRFQATFEQAAVGIAHVGLQGHWLEVNQKLCEIVGYTRAELLERTFQDITYPDDLATDLALVERVLAGDLGWYSLDKRYMHKAGHLIWSNLTVSLVRGPAGEPRYFVSVVEDITERKRAEQALLETEERFAKAFHANSAALAITRRRDGVFLDANASYLRLFGFERDELIGHTGIELGIYESFEQRAEIVRRLGAGERIYELELTLRAKSGERRDVLGSIEHMQVGSDECLLLILYDITERKRAEAALRRSEARFATMVAASPLGIAISRLRDGRFVSVNESYLGLVGYSADEILGHTAPELQLYSSPNLRGDVIADLQAGRSPQVLELTLRTKSGELRDTLISVVLTDFEDEPCLLGVMIDITERKRVERDFHEAAARLAGIVGSAMDAIISIDSAGAIQVFNTAAEQMFGCSAAEALGGSIDRFIPTRFRLGHAEHIRRFGTTGITSRSMHSLGELYAMRPDGAEFPIEATISQTDAAGEKIYTVIIRDVAERRQAEAAIKLSEERFAKAFNASPAAKVIVRAGDTRIVDANASYTRLIGFARAELLGRTPRELGLDLNQAVWEQLRRELGDGAMLAERELTIANRSGDRREVLFSVAAFELGGEACLMGTLVDITERKRAEAGLRASEELLRTVTETAQVGLAIVSADHHYRYANQTYKQFMRLPPGDVAGRHVRDVVGPLYDTTLRERLERALAGNQLVGPMNPPAPPGQEQRRYEARLEPGADQYGPMVAVVLVDLTERERALAALRASEERFAKAFRASPAAVTLTHTETGRFIDANESYLRLLGYTREEVIGRTALELNMYAFPDDRSRILRQVAAQGGMHEYEVQLRSKTGELFTVLVSTEALELAGEPTLLTTLFDITERKRAEQALQNERYRLRTLIDNLPDLIFLKDTDSRFIVANRATARFMGAEAPEELLGKTDFDFYPREHAASYFAEEQQILHSQQPLSGWEKRQTDVHGNSYWLSTIKVPLYDTSGQIVGLAGIERDITARKNAEDAVHQLNAELEQRVQERTAQLEAANRELEAFSYSVSHDLRAPLRAIAGFSRIVFEDFLDELPEDVREYMVLIRDNAQHMDALIGDLLAFARLSRQPLRRQPVGLAELVSQSLADVRQVYPEHPAELVIGELPSAWADPALLRQVLVNLLSNALKFTAKRANPRVEVGALPAPERADAPVFFVRDNGAGFDMRYAGKLFGVFQRLHRPEEYDGTGVGLAIVQRIIHRHGGQVWAESAIDQGATFFFTLGGIAHHE